MPKKATVTKQESANRQAELLEMAADMLDQFNAPMHYKELTQILVDSGLWANPWGKEPDQILYSAMHNNYKRHGKDSRILFMGGGMFVHCNVDGADFLELPEPSGADRYEETEEGVTKLPPARRQKEGARPAAEPSQPQVRRCGNCTHITYDGPQLHLREIGHCSMYLASGRCGTFPKSEPCPLWKHRTAAQVNRDVAVRADVILESKLVLARVHEKSRIP